MKKVTVDPAIEACWFEYYGSREWPGKVVAVRRENDMYAVLTEEDGKLFGIQFNIILTDRTLTVWDVTDDGIPFDSIEEFTGTKLVQALL